jgi:hypothetical protein
LSSASEPVSKSRRQFIKYGVAGAVGFGVASAIEIPILNNTIQNESNTIKEKDTTITSLQDQNSELQGKLGNAQQMQGFLTLNTNERPLVEAIAEAMIPTDSSDPGAKEAGVVYFIDRALAGSYGKAGNMYMQGPFVHPQTGSLTIKDITYSKGTIIPRLQAGTSYQYAFSPREFWRKGLMSLQTYCNSAFGNNFENLSSDQQIQVLQDLFDNKSDNSKLQDAFQAPNAAEFFNELHDMVTAGFWADPLYGGNIGMVGWKLLASNGVNSGTAQNHSTIELATASIPTKLPPLSLADLQRGAQM